MKKYLILVVLAMSAVAVSAWNPDAGSKSPTTQLFICDGTCPYEAIAEPWGKFTHNSNTGTFAFTGHHLRPYTSYTLLLYPQVECLGEKMSSYFGDVKMSGTCEYSGEELWLVRSNEVDCINHLVYAAGSVFE